MSSPSFEERLSWTTKQMPLTRAAMSRLPSLENVRLAMSIHLDIKVLPLLVGLMEKGAKIFLTTCNATTVRNDVVEYAVQRGAEAYAWQGMSDVDYQDSIARAIEWNPTHLCEMGADITVALHKSGKSHNVKAGLEATGSGINQLGNVAPTYPIWNWDDVPVKEGLHNRHMVGITTWHAFFSSTYLTLHGKCVLIVGYGLVGQGLCDAARAYGGSVLVCEKDAARAHQASYAGWHVVDLEEGLYKADVICTATGVPGVIRAEHFDKLRSRVFLLNAGHILETDVTALREYPTKQVLPKVEEIDVNGKSVYLLCGGSMANLTAGEGDSINAFDLTLAVMTAGIGHVIGEGADLPPGLHLLPENAWRSVI